MCVFQHLFILLQFNLIFIGAVFLLFIITWKPKSEFLAKIDNQNKEHSFFSALS